MPRNFSLSGTGITTRNARSAYQTLVWASSFSRKLTYRQVVSTEPTVKTAYLTIFKIAGQERADAILFNPKCDKGLVAH